jgi:sec-independent protein translocase protein TatC
VAITSLAIGFLFELPVVILGLVRLGVLTAARLRRNRRVGIVVCFADAVALPGIDPVTTKQQGAPLLVLFESSIWLASFFEKRWAAQAAAAEAAELEAEGATGTSQP